MTTVLILLGFVFYFTTIGYLVYTRNDSANEKRRWVALGLQGYTGIYLLVWAVFIEKQTVLSMFQCLKTEEAAPVLLTISILLIVICLIQLVSKPGKYRIIYGAEAKSVAMSAKMDVDLENDQDYSIEKLEKSKLPKLSSKDWLYLLLLTIASGIFLFYRLGSFNAPQTSVVMTGSGEHEIILDLGQEVDVSEMFLYLGHMDGRTIAVSYFDETADDWVVLQEEEELEDVYSWNEVKLNHKMRYLGIVSRSGRAVYHEIVLLDQDNQRILPINVENYPELFDEQELFPENVTYYYRTMFDEVYYSRSAYEFLQGYDMYECTHPPLGKILMAIGVWLFGITPFGWRFVCAVFGTLMTPVIYLFMHRLSGKTNYAVLAAVFLNLDFMHFALSRIATIDSIVALFILLMFTCMYYQLTQMQWKVNRLKQNGAGHVLGLENVYMLLGAVFAGMGIATKWTGVYSFAAIGILFLIYSVWSFCSTKEYKAIRKYLLVQFVVTGISYLIIAFTIYVTSFMPMSKARGSSLKEAFLANNLFMLQFHSTSVFDHPYSSSWYTWPLDLVPLVDAGTQLADTSKVCIIATFGNPIIWWGGLAAFVYVLYRAVFLKDKKAGYLSCAYISMLMPWWFITRTVFIYQYYACSILLSVILAYTLLQLHDRYTKLNGIMIEAALVCMILFYPMISGFAIDNATIAVFMQWFETWKVV